MGGNSERSNIVAIGSVEGTGAAINVPIGFIPRRVEIKNIDDIKGIFPGLVWDNNMPAASGFKDKVNRSLADGALAIGSVSKKEVLLGATATFQIDNVFYTKTTAEVGFTATTDDITADASTVQEAVYLVCVSSAGTLSLVKGTTTTGAGLAPLPSIPVGLSVLGYVRIAVAAGATDFNATTDDLDAAHLTTTYVDFTPTSPVKVTVNGISSYAGASATTGAGFTIGADTDVNVLGETIAYIAYG
jgi:hypothetical protein